MTFDMFLPEKGGVCVMFSDKCNTFVPDNTLHNRAFTKALIKLDSLTAELRANVNPDIWMMDWIVKMFGKWEAIFAKIDMAS